MTYNEFLSLPLEKVTLAETRSQVSSILSGRPGFRDRLEASIFGYLLDGTYERAIAVQDKWIAAGRPK